MHRKGGGRLKKHCPVYADTPHRLEDGVFTLKDELIQSVLECLKTNSYTTHYTWYDVTGDYPRCFHHFLYLQIVYSLFY